MDYSIAKNKILSLFKKFQNSKDSVVYGSLSEEEITHIFYTIQNKIQNLDGLHKCAFAYFVYFTMDRFNRFNTLRPNDTDELKSRYITMYNCLKRLELRHNIFTWFSKMCIIRWEAYRKCANIKLNQEHFDFIDKKISELENIVVENISEQQAANINKVKNELKDLLYSFKSGIKTTIVTHLPYKLTPKNCTIHLYCEGIEVDVAIKNTLKDCPIPNSRISDGSTLDEMGLSKNSYSECTVNLQFHCLIDVGRNLDSVSYSDKEEFNWNYLFDFTYKAIKSIWFFMQDSDDGFVTWPPLPQDIGAITWQISSDHGVIDGGMFTNPATGYHISSVNKEKNHFEISKEITPTWSDNAFYYARLYARAGQFEETIFWLNVSTEALIDEFIQKVCSDKEVYEKMVYQENKFTTAEEILSEQFPEMKGKVKWPSVLIHASVYTKLKRVLEYINQKDSAKKILKRYSYISGKRNGLFHGGNHNIYAKDMNEIFIAYNLLKEELSQFLSTNEE